MPDYSKGKIYMIEPTCEYEEGDVYYGSTCDSLTRRFNKHRCKLNNCFSKLLIEKYGRDNVRIMLIKEFPCSSKSELTLEEKKYITTNKCVNKCVPNQNNKDSCKAYYDKNRELIRGKASVHREQNKDAVNAYNREWNKVHREERNRKQLARYHEKKLSQQYI